MTLHIVELLGMIGTDGPWRGVRAGRRLVIEAAVKLPAVQGGWLDTALNTLRKQPYGRGRCWSLAALGLIVFGVYGLCEARWRKV